jgi:hypothetical protein
VDVAAVVEVKRGDAFVTNPDKRLAHQHVISVMRVARDESWADIRVCNWAVMWTKRQPLRDGTFAFPHAPCAFEDFAFNAQERDHMAMLAERKAAS